MFVLFKSAFFSRKWIVFMEKQEKWIRQGFKGLVTFDSTDFFECVTKPWEEMCTSSNIAISFRLEGTYPFTQLPWHKLKSSIQVDRKRVATCSKVKEFSNEANNAMFYKQKWKSSENEADKAKTELADMRRKLDNALKALEEGNVRNKKGPERPKNLAKVSDLWRFPGGAMGEEAKAYMKAVSSATKGRGAERFGYCVGIGKGVY